MAEAGQGARATLYYAPYDEVLETSWWIGMDQDDGALVFGHSHDEMVANQGGYFDTVAQAMQNLLTINGKVVGISVNELDTRKGRKNTKIYDLPGTQFGNPLPNNTYLYLRMSGLTSIGAGGEPAFTIRNALKLSGQPIAAQDAGRWEAGYLAAQVQQFINAILAGYVQEDGDNVVAQVRNTAAIQRSAVCDVMQATPVLGRDKTRTGNVGQRRGIIPAGP